MSYNYNTWDMNSISENELPEVISSEFNSLQELGKNVDNAVNMASIANEKAEQADVSIGFFKSSKKEAIELLQDATKGLAEAQISATEAQKVFFSYQKKLANATKFLLGLGISNIAMNRTIVRELELKLKGASQGELNDLAKKEIKNVIIQLKRQEDIMKKQSELNDKVNVNHRQLIQIDKQLDNIKVQDEFAYKKITQNTATISKYKEILKAYQEKDKKQDMLIDMVNNKIENIDDKHNETIKALKIYLSDQASRTTNQYDSVKADIGSLEQKIDKSSNEIHNVLNEKINSVSNDLLKLDKKVDNTDDEKNKKIEELNNRINILDVITSKILWKVGITFVAVGSLILNILQIAGVI